MTAQDTRPDAPAPDASGTDAQEIEFDLLARWTEEAVGELGPEYAIPAGCRGSGSPADLAWLAEASMIGADTRVVDVGSGRRRAGGVARRALRRGARLRRAHARRRRGGAAAVRAALADGRRRGVAAADAGRSTSCCASACCAPCRAGPAPGGAELQSRPRAGGEVGLLVFVARGPLPGPLPEGNDFPTEDALYALLEGAGLTVVQSRESDGLAEAPTAWRERADAVDAALERRHGEDPRWRRAEEQTARIARLIGGGHVRPLLVHARAA